MMESLKNIPNVQLWRFIEKLLPLDNRYQPFDSYKEDSANYLAFPFGSYTALCPPDLVKEFTLLMLTGESYCPEFKLFDRGLKNLSEGEIFIDVGANGGLYTLHALEYGVKNIVAYEPEPTMFSVLKATLSCNNINLVQCKQVALGEAEDEIRFVVGCNGRVANSSDSNNTEIITVPVTTLDSEAKNWDKVGLIKIDCEGFELSILRGMKKLLASQRPALFVEIHPQFLSNFGHSVEQVVDFLSPLYNLEFWDFNKRRNYNKLLAFLRRYYDPGYQIKDEKALYKYCNQEVKPGQLHLLATPKSIES